MQDDTVRAETATELEALYREQGSRLWRSLYLFTGDPDVASDAASEAFVQALARGDRITSPERWVWKAAFKIAAGEMKDRGRRRPLAEADTPVPEPVAELAQALSTLSKKQRTCVILHHIAGYSYEEIASILGSSASTVGVHVHRARNKLAEILEVER